MRKIIFASILLCIATTAQAQGLPYSNVKRAEAVRVLLSSVISDIPEYTGEIRYPDVIEGEWYVPYIMEAVRRNILNGNPRDGLLHPHRPVTRAEFLKIMGVTFGIPMNLSHSYKDIDPNAWYAPYAGIAYQYRLFQEADRSKLRPNALILHKEVSEILEVIFKTHPQLKKVTPAAKKEANHGSATQKYTTVTMVKKSMQRAMQRNAAVSNQARTDLLNRMNEIRMQEGLPTLKFNSNLTSAALKHSKDMWDRRYFSHTTPEGKTYIDRIRDVKYIVGSPYFYVGENLARGQLTIDRVIEDWMNSPSHRKNLLHPQFDEVGIGLYGNLWTVKFGFVRYF